MKIQLNINYQLWSKTQSRKILPVPPSAYYTQVGIFSCSLILNLWLKHSLMSLVDRESYIY